MDVYNARFTFDISCHPPIDPQTHEVSRNRGEMTFQILRLKIIDSDARPTAPGFTIFFKQTGMPSILRLDPSYIEVPGVSKQLSVPHVEEDRATPERIIPAEAAASLSNGQKSMNSYVNSIKASFKDRLNMLKIKAHEVLASLPCHEKASQAAALEKLPSKVAMNVKTPKVPEVPNVPEIIEVADIPEIPKASSPPSVPTASLDHIVGPPPELQADAIDPDETISTPSPHWDPTITHTSDQAISTSSPVSISQTPDSTIFSVALKSFALALILISLLAWLFLRCRDPRRRADRAARREERQTKRLYRRAARLQALKTWGWNLRMKFRLASTSLLQWNEKQIVVSAQEDALEEVMKNDIRALRNAHRVVSSMTAVAAEEGRAGFIYTPGESSRRTRSLRSVSTLPGYESEGSQPPPYEVGTGGGEDTPDSSVVSTSPRISRDGTNSDFDEKFERLDLYEDRMGLLGQRSSGAFPNTTVFVA